MVKVMKANLLSITMQSHYGIMALSRQAAKRMLKEMGAKRVSDSAADALAEAINRFAYGTAKKAVALASHAKRETVKVEDVELAS